MKEFPKFDFKGTSFDLCFYDDSVQLYAVENVFSGMMISQLIPAANDYIAMNGFADFLATRKEKNDKEVYFLYRLGELNIQKIEISDTEKVKLFDSREDISEWLEAAKTFMISCNDED